MTIYSATKDAKELSYLYDLYIAPGWRELFDQLVDAEVKLPAEGKFLDAGCGTGGYAIDLAGRLGDKVEVSGMDDDFDRLVLAQGKATIAKLDNLRFVQGSLESLGAQDADFDFVVADLSLLAPAELPERLEDILLELKRVAKYGAQVVLKLATRGSFDEFYSLYWEALLEVDLLDYTAQIEDLIRERLTIEQIETAVREAGFRHLESLTETLHFEFETAEAFFAAPLIEQAFLGHWLGLLASEREEQQVREALMRIIERDYAEGGFEVSAKATLVIAKR
jgi:ubiquinone/menaquinone biosynthesis C-methylase UbiE